MISDIPIKGEKHLSKDSNSGAILNNDRVGLQSRLLERERVRKIERDSNLLRDLELRVSELEILVKGIRDVETD